MELGDGDGREEGGGGGWQESGEVSISTHISPKKVITINFCLVECGQ
jgi:hypothetical protein